MSCDDIPPLVLVGFEGVNGMILSFLFAFPFAYFMPGSDNGHYEDIYEAFTLPFNSPKLAAILAAFFVVIFAYNVFCIYITFLLSSIYHCVMDNLRPAMCMVFGLIFYYTWGIVGEPWNARCWFEVVGILLMFLGTSVYGGQIKLPFLSSSSSKLEDHEYHSDQEFEHIPVRDTPVFSARQSTPLCNGADVDPSSLLTKSPAINAMKGGSPALGHSHIIGEGHYHASSRQTQQGYGSM
eukprot:UN02767